MASPATLSIFRHLFASVAEEMGVTLGRTAYSPNIKERRDYSCALFYVKNGAPLMLAQAAHIPVHLGAMPASVKAAAAACAPLQEGDIVLLNDPYQGSNHLPDLTMVSAISAPQEKQEVRQGAGLAPLFLAASRAHHADAGGMSPGSMPLSTELFQEGIIIPPLKIVAAGERNNAVWQLLLRNVRTPQEREGDLAAQLAAHATGARRVRQILARYGLSEVQENAESLLAYAERLAREAIKRIPDGRYSFRDVMDDDGQTEEALPIQVTVSVNGSNMSVDFEGTATAMASNISAVPAIVHSAVVYCLRCVALALLDSDLPMNDGVLRPLSIRIPPGSLLDPPPNSAVAAGNIETSQRIVDVVLGALAHALPGRIAAAGQGTMNNLTFGGSVDGRAFAYYETIGGGAGAGPNHDGAHGMHVHMSNTLNTPVEALEYDYPAQVTAYHLRRGSGGAGKRRGGDGLVRRVRFLSTARVTITSERRRFAPYGLQGGQPGQRGQNMLLRDGEALPLGGKADITVHKGDEIEIATPGGG